MDDLENMIYAAVAGWEFKTQGEISFQQMKRMEKFCKEFSKQWRVNLDLMDETEKPGGL